jgi:hypothetical protein
MTQTALLKKVIGVLKILRNIDNVEIIKYTIESLIEELEDLLDQKKERDKE